MKKEEFDRLVAGLAQNPEALAKLVAEFSKQVGDLAEAKNIVPLSIYSQKSLTVLEATVLYLSQQGKRLRDVAELLDRNERSLWHTLEKAKKKHTEALVADSSAPIIPLTVFTSKLSPLKSIVLHCKQILGMRNKEIARWLNRDPRTISSVYSQAKRGDRT